jgi:hypothetical protein
VGNTFKDKPRDLLDRSHSTVHYLSLPSGGAFKLSRSNGNPNRAIKKHFA